jgi:hypothetical protein
MKKKLFIGIICSVTAILACDSSIDLFKSKNENISFEFRTDDGLYNYDLHKKYIDSVKIDQSRTTYLTVQDDMKELSAVFEFDKGESNVMFTFDKDTVMPNNVYTITTNTRMGIGITGKLPGEVLGVLRFTDYYGESLSLLFSLFVFDNLYPTCKMDIKEVKELSEYEYLIDLSKSFDADAKFGGNIISYEYKINNYYFLVTEKSAIYHIFPAAGTYDIKCRVKDNDGAWSPTVTTKITM